MEHDARVDAVERELDALVAAVGAGPLAARVPTCPDFAVDDLAKHVGEFCGFWAHVLCEGTRRPKTPFPEVGPEGRAGWLAALAGHLVSELQATPPETPVWTWYEPDRSAAFVARRCSNEVAVHRVDAQVARGAADPVEAELAADGIDEISVFLEADGPDGQRGTPGSGQTLHVHGTDHQPAEWLITLDPGGVRITREHAKGDLAIKGAVSDLEMLLYQRPTVGPVERFGDPAVLEAFYRAFTFD
ncbi:maleylpyruvate isomerase family mycothiol-dependent enzyme [soil metagenome]